MVPMAQTVQRKCKILDYILKNKSITTREATEIIDLDAFWTSRLVQKMQKERIIKNIAPYGKRKIYIIDPDRLDLIKAILKFYYTEEA